MFDKKKKPEKEVEIITPADVGSAETVLGDITEGAETKVLPVDAPAEGEERELYSIPTDHGTRHSKRSAS